MVKNSLLRDEPYHLPGYQGYVPQFKFRIGDTFGKTTHEILYSPERVTPTTMPYRPPPEKKEPLQRATVCQDESWNKTKLHGSMIPGYTGYIPRGQKYFGQRYTSACRNAIDNFEKDLIVKQNLEHSYRMVPRKPLPQLCKPEDYPIKPRAFEYGTSPYKLPRGHHDRYFVSGYTGFVPRSQELIAKCYPQLTTDALDLHKIEQARVRGNPKDNVIVFERAKTAPPKIYVPDSGLIPNYTGHVPTMKYKFGKTFGATTYNALNKSI